MKELVGAWMSVVVVGGLVLGLVVGCAKPETDDGRAPAAGADELSPPFTLKKGIAIAERYCRGMEKDDQEAVRDVACSMKVRKGQPGVKFPDGSQGFALDVLDAFKGAEVRSKDKGHELLAGGMRLLFREAGGKLCLFGYDLAAARAVAANTAPAASADGPATRSAPKAPPATAKAEPATDPAAPAPPAEPAAKAPSAAVEPVVPEPGVPAEAEGTEPAAEAPEERPLPPLKDYPPSKYDDPSSLPLEPLTAFVFLQLKSIGAVKLSEIWGKKPSDLAFLTPSMFNEVEDTRPWLKVYEQPTGLKARGKELYLLWGFVQDELFLLRLRFRSKVKGLDTKLIGFFGRQPDRRSESRSGVTLMVWEHDGLEITVREKGKAFALTLADRARAERFRFLLEPVDEAERLVYKSMAYFYDRAERDVEAALRVNQQAAKAVPGFGDAWVNICHAQIEKGEQEEAITSCKKALEVTGEDSVRGEASYYLGLVDLYQGRKSEGVSKLKEAKRLIPKDWVIASDVRMRLSALNGNKNDRVLGRAVFDYYCNELRDGNREARIPEEFGFEDWEALSQAAEEELVDLVGLHEKAKKRCAIR